MKTKQQRDICNVIDQIVSVIPRDELAALMPELQQIKDRALYTAPELQRERWVDLCAFLNSNLGPPQFSWQREVAEIVSGKRGDT